MSIKKLSFVNRFNILALVLILSSYGSLCFSKQNVIEFFYSNNNQVIDTKTAYNKLIGKEQRTLKKAAIRILQKEHIEQGTFKNILGTYTSTTDNKTTADNSVIFVTSPYQEFNRDKIFYLAKTIAST